MVAFKKSFLVLAVMLVALLGSAGTANAQHTVTICTASAVPPLVRAEGIAELVGDIVVDCTLPNGGSIPFSAPTFVTNITVTLTTTITNQRLLGSGGGDPAVDAVLIVNEITAGPGVALFQAGNTDIGSNAVYTTNTPVTEPIWGNLLNASTVQWAGVQLPTPFVAPGTFDTIVRISNLRANVSQLGIPGNASFPSTQVTAFVSFTGPTTVPVNNNVLQVGVPLLGLITTVSSLVTAQQCVGLNVDSSGNIVLLAGGTFTVTLAEGFATAFKTIGTPTVFQGATQVESGFTSATQSTRFIIRFANVPNGVKLGSPGAITGTPVTLKIVKLGGTDSNGFGQGTHSPGDDIPVTGNSAFVVYEVVTCDPFAQESVKVPITVGFKSDTVNDLPAIGIMQSGASFAPVSTVTTASTTAPRPRFVDTTAYKSVFQITRCITNLLFPFVTNQSGFDTGFAISNTSADDKGTIAQGGTCTVYYFGSTTGGGAAPGPQTSIVVASGKQIVWSLSGGNPAANITGTPGFQGYVFAQCQFQFAHGFAYIQDGFGGVPSLAQGYLALVVPWNGVAASRFAGTGEELGH